MAVHVRTTIYKKLYASQLNNTALADGGQSEGLWTAEIV